MCLYKYVYIQYVYKYIGIQNHMYTNRCIYSDIYIYIYIYIYYTDTYTYTYRGHMESYNNVNVIPIYRRLYA